MRTAPKLVGDLVVVVLEHRERDLVDPGIGADLGQRVLLIGVDGQEGDALLLELGGQVFSRGA